MPRPFSWIGVPRVAGLAIGLFLIGLGNACRRGIPPPATGGAAVASPPGRVAEAPSTSPVLVFSDPPAHRFDRTATIRFDDITATTGIDFVHTSGNDPEKYYPTANASGVAMFDYDGDGRQDLYFATTRNLPLDAPTRSRGNRLYRNLGGGRFEDVTDAAGVGYRGFTHGVAVGDVDDDGFPDLFLANLGPNALYLNNGDGTFRDASADSGLTGPPWSTGAAFLDYDGDGVLDLYVSCYGLWAQEGPHKACGTRGKIRTYCSPLDMTPARHHLYRGLGDGRFEETTEAAGVLREDGRGMGVLAVDVNRDGRTDLYVANDICPHFLFLNKGDGTFEDITESSGAAYRGDGAAQAGMGVDAVDLDGDELPELFVTNFRGDYNTLHANLDGRNFQDESARAGIVKDSMAYVGWGCSLADLDNDGRPDIFVVNSHIDDNLPLIGQDVPQAEPAKVWRGQDDRGRFLIAPDPGTWFAADHVARGAAFGDLDDDGGIDAVVSILDDHPAVLRNVSIRGHWIGFDLIGRRSNRSAIGAAVAVTVGGKTLHRQVKGGGSYISANDPRVLVGLGSAERVERVEIRWPSGARSMLDSPRLDEYHLVREPDVAGGVAAPAGDGR